jgi:hypothetical protein
MHSLIVCVSFQSIQVRKDMRDRYGVQFTLYDKIDVSAAQAANDEVPMMLNQQGTQTIQFITLRTHHGCLIDQVNGAGRHPLYSALFQYEPELSGYPTRIAWVSKLIGMCVAGNVHNACLIDLDFLIQFCVSVLWGINHPQQHKSRTTTLAEFREVSARQQWRACPAL